jgi:glycyl-tRNA synthetase beta chain
MNDLKPLLIEIGVEEMPAGVSVNLAKALFDEVGFLLNDHCFAPENLTWGVTPRRLLVYSSACHTKQHDYNEEIWGPPQRIAFTDGIPTKAAFGFASKLGLSMDNFELADKGDGKGLYMKTIIRREGLLAVDVIAGSLPTIIRKLPSSKQMQWQDGENRNDTFIRPVRWIVACLGDDLIPFSFAGIKSGKISYGHRVHGSSGEIDINDPFRWLERQCVSADRRKRLDDISNQLTAAAAAAGVELIADTELLEEVTDLTEWPHVITGHYDEVFVDLPAKVRRIELKHHQRCFSSCNTGGATNNIFFAIANIISKNPAMVAKGNERVVNARLADAAFYFKRDPLEPLDERVEKLSQIVFQNGLGMVGDQVRRMRGFVLDNARALGVDANNAQRAAYLCKSDLTTGLVGEFPELQGHMGGIYARMDGENEEVASAIEHHYSPTGADDTLPSNRISRALGIAERADKLLGYFHIGRIPTASADPFGLRRAAIGLVRLLSDSKHPVAMTLDKVIDEAAKQWNQQRVTIAISDETKQLVHEFLIERLLGMSTSQGFSKTSIDAAVNSSKNRPLCYECLIARHLMGFENTEEGQAITAANKRIANILKKTTLTPSDVDPLLFTEAAEKALFGTLLTAESGFNQAISIGSFEESISSAWAELAKLREPVDQFFEDVMVMAEDEKVRANRLALLTRLRTLFLNLADISRL